MINKLRALLPAVAMLLLCGCLDYTDKLTINPDGSGAVHMEIRTTLPIEMFDMMSMGMMAGGENSAPFPPISKRAAAKIFPAKDFDVSISSKTGENETNHVVIDAKFKDIAALLNSRYAESRGLSLKIEGDKLVFKAKTGVEAMARAAGSENAEAMQASMSAFPGQKADTNGPIKFQFEVVLPAAVAESTGVNSGNSAKWIIAKDKMDVKQLGDKLAETLRATCPTAGLKFSPITPVRLALENFNDLATNTIKATATVDAEKVKAAAKFVPYTLRITRSLDLSGAGNSQQENAAVLTGAIVIPAALAPQQWGEVKLEEAKDAKGKSLVPAEDGDEGSVVRSMTRMYGNFGGEDADAEEDDDEEENAGKKAAAKAKEEIRHTVAVSFNPPDWQTAGTFRIEVSKLKATAALLYFGGSQVVKLPNAIPEKSIMKMDGAGSFSFDENPERTFSDPKLTQLGIKLKLEHAMQQNDSLNMSLSAEGKNAVISSLQIYDADGKPWPTTLSKNDFGEGASYSVNVNGKPKPPLSIALLAPDAMTKVEVPIVLEKIPVQSKGR